MTVNVEAERKLIALGGQAKNLLEDEAFLQVCAKLEQEYWGRFKHEALTPETRALLQAKAQVLDDVKLGLHALMDSGVHATSNRDKREKAEHQRKP